MFGLFLQKQMIKKQEAPDNLEMHFFMIISFPKYLIYPICVHSEVFNTTGIRWLFAQHLPFFFFFFKFYAFSQ